RMTDQILQIMRVTEARKTIRGRVNEDHHVQRGGGLEYWVQIRGVKIDACDIRPDRRPDHAQVGHRTLQLCCRSRRVLQREMSESPEPRRRREGGDLIVHACSETCCRTSL